MKKSKSFSSYGNYLDRKNSLKANPQILSKTLERGRQRPMQINRPQPKFIQGFDRITGRQKPNSFQIFNVRDKNNQTNYQVKDQMITTRNAFYPTRRESEPRLKSLLPMKEKYQKKQVVCHRLGNICRDQNLMTTRDLQNTRKSFHNMDFLKQNHKSHSYIKNPEGRQITYDQSLMKQTVKSNSNKKQILRKISNVHSFDSYTKRDFLSEKKLLKKGAPLVSGSESYKISPDKYKGNWKTYSAVKFGSVPDKNLSRYDRDCDVWNTKLQYQPKEILVMKKTPVMEISKQTSRVLNEVHSKYPIRLAA